MGGGEHKDGGGDKGTVAGFPINESVFSAHDVLIFSGIAIGAWERPFFGLTGIHNITYCKTGASYTYTHYWLLRVRLDINVLFLGALDRPRC